MPDNIVTLDPRPQAEAFAPTYAVAPGCLISGTPNERGVTQFTSEDATVNAGVWTCGTYRERIPSYPCDELFVVIEGSVTLTEEGRDPRSSGQATPLSSGAEPCANSRRLARSASST